MSLAARYLAHPHQASERLIHYPVCRSTSKLALKSAHQKRIYTYVYFYKTHFSLKRLRINAGSAIKFLRF